MFNKRICFGWRVIVFLLFALSSVAMCDYPVLVNPSFEPDYDGWKVVNPNNYIGTHEGGGQWWEPYAVSEISPDGTATDGDWYLMWFDSGVYQSTKETIGEDEMYYVSVDACQSWDAVIVKVDLGYEESKNNYIVDHTETFYPTRRLELMDDGELLYVGTWERFHLSEYFPSPSAVGKPFYIKIGNEDVGEWLAIDNVQLGGYKDYAVPIYPPDRGRDIPVDAVLQWTLEEGYSCDVWFGTNGDPNFWKNEQVVFDSTETSHDPFGATDLELDTTYYWRVDPIDPNEGYPFTYTGKVWSFTTISLTPVIVDGPYSETGDTVTLTVEAAGIGELTYKWYKVGDPDFLYETTTEPSLTIDVVSDLGLEGYYYCTVSNEYGTSEPSAIVRVMQPRLVGWWKLDEDLTDSVAEEVPGAPTHDGTGIDDFVEGIDEGKAAYFAGLGKLVTISDSGEYYNFYPEGMTAIAWVKCELDGTWDGIVGKQSNEGDWWVVGWSLGVNDAGISRVNFSVRNPWTDVFGSPDEGNINDGEWHLVAGAIKPNYSERTCQMRVYVDGALKDASDDLDIASVLTTSSYDVLIGTINQNWDVNDDGSFHGAIDDVRIYNYALEEMEIAMMYLEHNEGLTVCVDQIEPWRQFDVVGEPGEPSFCKVDIEDMAAFASAWMKCNLLKECLQ